MKVFVSAALLAASVQAFGADPDALTKSNRELAAREAQKPQWQMAQEDEDARIKMKSFDPGTTGKTAYILSGSTDTTIPRAKMISILYKDIPCKLPIVNAQSMWSAETVHGRGLVTGCWGKLLSPAKDRLVIVTPSGDSREESLTAYVETRILPDGSAKFVKPAMSHDEYMRNVQTYQNSLR